VADQLMGGGGRSLHAVGERHVLHTRRAHRQDAAHEARRPSGDVFPEFADPGGGVAQPGRERDHPLGVGVHERSRTFTAGRRRSGLLPLVYFFWNFSIRRRCRSASACREERVAFGADGDLDLLRGDMVSKVFRRRTSPWRGCTLVDVLFHLWASFLPDQVFIDSMNSLFVLVLEILSRRNSMLSAGDSGERNFRRIHTRWRTFFSRRSSPSGAGLVDVDGREDPLLRDLPSRTSSLLPFLELLEDHLVHPAPSR